MKYRLTALAVLLAIASALVFAPFGAAAAPKNDTNPFKQTVTAAAYDLTGTQVGTFNGTVTVQKFVNNNGMLAAVVKVVGTVTNDAGTVLRNVKTTATVPVAISGSEAFQASAIAQQATCEILDLDIGPIHLDLLGLVVDIAPIHINITAEQGSGNLLGNLLCAIAGLLDPGNPLEDILNQLVDLLNQILAILG